MSLHAFRKAGHPSTLLAAFLYFDVSFMVWVILGPLGPFLSETYHLSATQKGLLTAVPLLGGSFFRPMLGWMTERYRRPADRLDWPGVHSAALADGLEIRGQLQRLPRAGIVTGHCRREFCRGVPLASAWYPPEHQGLAMGIAGAGNSGTILATLFAPRLAQAIGWRSVFGLAMIPVALVWIVFFLLAKDAPTQRVVKTWRDYAAVFEDRRHWLVLLSL